MVEFALDTFNAKRMSAEQVAESFVMPDAFLQLAGGDHAYVIGPRGSGKTTLLRMLTGEGLSAWRGRDAGILRDKIDYASIFLPADELWASQLNDSTARAAFTAQMLYAFVEQMRYRTSKRGDVHLPVGLVNRSESDISKDCAEAWGLERVRPGFYGLLEALDLFLTRLTDEGEGINHHRLSSADSLALLTFGIRSFNRAAGEPRRRWALLLDEMELAPSSIHRIVTAFVRGGAETLILKVSMSPFDRFMHYYGGESGAPVPGHDFQTIYLSGQSRREIGKITSGLWAEMLRVRRLPYVPLRHALDVRQELRDPRTRRRSVGPASIVQEAHRLDADFARWLEDRKIDPANLESLSYNERSASIRKVVPLLQFRDSLLNFREGRPVRRSRKKSLEPFTGPDAVTTMLEGNPRWIKTAFSHMLQYYDASTGRVSAGFQFDSISSLANRFESLLRVLPSRQSGSSSIAVIDLVDIVAQHLNRRNTSKFNPDPPNGFTVDRRTPRDVTDAIVLGMYAGAFVHIRDRKSPSVLSDFEGQRFRLAYLVAIRDGKEFPLRLGKDISLASMLVNGSNSAAPATRPGTFDLENL